MFTGIIESVGTVSEIHQEGSNKIFWIECPLSAEFKIDQSVSHSGVCLTIERITEQRHRVTAIDETLQKTNLGVWTTGTRVNLERCLTLNGRLDGHFVQGHVDTIGTCVDRIEKGGSWEFEIEFPENFAALVIEKGSICLNGISLTAFNVKRNRLTVAVIPYTFEHTDIQYVKVGDQLNLEFDLIGKYLNRFRELK